MICPVCVCIDTSPVSSPIARALIGKNEGDVVAIRIPSGTVEYEISEVEYI